LEASIRERANEFAISFLLRTPKSRTVTESGLRFRSEGGGKGLVAVLYRSSIESGAVDVGDAHLAGVQEKAAWINEALCIESPESIEARVATGVVRDVEAKRLKELSLVATQRDPQSQAGMFFAGDL
jgi:hypothetical protein